MDDQKFISHGKDFYLLDDFKKAIEYREKQLKTAIEIGDRDGQGAAYGNLGNVFHSLSDYRKAIEYYDKALKIAIEIGDRGGEGRAYGNLGSAFQSLGEYRKATEYFDKALKTAMEIGDRRGEGGAYGNLGNVNDSLGDSQKAIEYHEKHLKIAIEVGNFDGEGKAYGNLGNAYQSVDDYRKGIEYNEKALKIAVEIGDRAGEGRACGNLVSAYQSLGDYRNAIDYHEKRLKIVKEIGDRRGEGGAYGNLGNAYDSLGDYRKALEYHEKHLKIAVEIGDRAGEGGAYGNLGNAYHSLGDYRKALEYHEKRLKIAKEIGDRAGQGEAYHNIGNAYSFLEQFENAVYYFVSAVVAFNSLRSLLKSQDNWKVTFREQHETTYTALWRSLIRSEKFDEALFAAEQGRAQTLSDNLLIQYKLPTSLSAALIDTKETVSCLFTERSTPTIFLETEGRSVYIWFLSKKNKVAFRRGRLVGDKRERDPIHALLRSSLEKIEAEASARSNRASEFSMKVRGEGPGKLPLPLLDNPFKPFYDAVIGPILDMLGPQDDELLIVPNGTLGRTPWAAVFESMRIRTVPSLTSYQLILSATEGYHKRTGVLLVGNPCLKGLKIPLDDLPCAQEEVEMISSFFNTRPLTGREAAKAEVVKRMPSVGLIHVAAHGNMRTGEIYSKSWMDVKVP